MPYVIYDPAEITAAMQKASQDGFKHRDDQIRPVLFFFDEINSNAYRPATCLETFTNLPEDPNIDVFEAKGLPRILLNADETQCLLTYCQKKDPDISLENLPSYFKRKQNGLRELQNCFGVENMINNRRERLYALLNCNIDKQQSKINYDSSSSIRSHKPKPR